MNAVLREPLVHFFMLGAAVFALFALFDDTPPPVAAEVITVTEDDARRLAGAFEATWRRSPNPTELNHLIDSFVREEVYVREALALGLDRGDAVIRSRLQMKMEFLTESGAGAITPDDATLEAHLAAFPERFAQAPLVGFEQVMIDDTIGTEALMEIRALMDAGGIPDGVRLNLLPPTLPAGPPRVVDGTFGTGFFEALATLPTGKWAGPVTSSFGRHLVRVTERRDTRLPPLSEIRERVESDWRAVMSVQLREERYKALVARYLIVRPDDPEGLRQ
ncbi:peptidyl-prolyl cis-trans isomerase [Meridianimarinicoccus aquatilis]|nr:peptidylprolyl isomerase [Fluviibacterium aquatile]